MDLFVRPAAVIGCRHEDDLLPFIDFVKEAPRPYTISPGFGFPSLQPFDVRPVMGIMSELGVDVLLKLFFDAAKTGSTDSSNVFLKGVGLEDPVTIQSSRLVSWRHPGSLSLTA